MANSLLLKHLFFHFPKQSTIMAYKKKTTSAALDKANSRLSGIKAIDAALDLGD